MLVYMKFVSEKLYKDILQVIPIICVDIYIFNPVIKKFLFFKRKNQPEKGKYCCPGGRVIKGESLKKAALRKLREETGWKASPSQLFLFGVSDTLFKNSRFGKSSTHTLNLSFLYSTDKTKKILMNNEHTGYKWLKGAEKNIVPFVKGMVKNLKKQDFNPFIYYQQNV